MTERSARNGPQRRGWTFPNRLRCDQPRGHRCSLQCEAAAVAADRVRPVPHLRGFRITYCMGGFGSGRPRERARVEELLCIDVDRAARGVCFDVDDRGLRRRRFPEAWEWSNGVRVTLTLELDAGGRPSLRLNGSTEQRIGLLERRTPTGGRYWVARCPYSGHVVRRLYLTTDGRIWAGRRALRLKHASTAMDPLARAQRRVQKLKARLAERGCTWDEEAGGWRRPRHCRRDWLERAAGMLDAANDRASAAWVRAVAMTFP